MILHQWFNENRMTSNPEKCHYIVIDSKGPSSKIMVKKKKKKEITITNKGKLSSNLLDSKLSLENHRSSLSLCRKAENRCPSQVKKLLYILS